VEVGDDVLELFGEVGGRAVLACAPKNEDELRDLAAGLDVRLRLVGSAGGDTLLGVGLDELREAWDGSS
jgi:hypothetical protein